ncbi:hypothetical protein [Actinomadura sp. GC306]|nr:hypothetical protein [Actinomadura sp. GC306]
MGPAELTPVYVTVGYGYRPVWAAAWLAGLLMAAAGITRTLRRQ